MESLNHSHNKKKFNIVVVSVLIAGLLLGGVVGGALYALVFDRENGTTQQRVTNVSSGSNSNEQAKKFTLTEYSKGLKQLNIARGVYVCDFDIRAYNNNSTKYTADIQYKSEQEEVWDTVGVGMPAASLRIDLISPQGLFDWYYYDYEEQDIPNKTVIKLLSDWDGVQYSGSFPMRSLGSADYPVIDVHWDISKEILARYNAYFKWDLACTPVQEIREQKETEGQLEPFAVSRYIESSTDDFAYQGTGGRVLVGPDVAGDYECSIDVTHNERPEYSKFDQPYLIGGGGISISTLENYFDYSQPPTTQSLIYTNPWDEKKSFFGLQVKDEQPLIEVSPAYAESNAQWVVACNKLNPENRVSSLSREGLNVERFYSNLKQGTYVCSSDAIWGRIEYPNQEESVDWEEDKSDPGSWGILQEIEITNTSTTSAPYITLGSNWHGYGAPWSVECNPK